jgi:hypothetical protein
MHPVDNAFLIINMQEVYYEQSKDFRRQTRDRATLEHVFLISGNRQSWHRARSEEYCPMVAEIARAITRHGEQVCQLHLADLTEVRG